MATIQDIDSAISNLAKQDRCTTILYQFLLNCKNGDFEYTLDKYKKANGEQYTCIGTVVKNMNNDLNKYANVTWKVRDVFELFNKTYPIFNPAFYKESLESCTLMRHHELVYDTEIFSDIIRNYNIYIDDESPYPSFAIYSTENNRYHWYNIYKYFAQLPINASLSFDRKLPTVDHINRNKFDSRLSNLRYCTTQQNAFNRCNSYGKNKYHGVQDRLIAIRDCSTTIEYKIVSWAYMFDSFIFHNPDFKTDYNNDFEFIDIHEECCSFVKQHVHEFQDKINIMNLFIYEFFKIINSNVLYSKETRIEDIHSSEYKYTTLLTHIVTSFKHHSSGKSVFKTTFKHDYIAALAYDIYNYVNHGQYAHMNFLRSPPKTSNIVLKADEILSPVEVLNRFEKEMDYEFIQKTRKRNDCYKHYSLREDGIILEQYVCKEHVLTGDYTSCLTCLDDNNIHNKCFYYKHEEPFIQNGGNIQDIINYAHHNIIAGGSSENHIQKINNSCEKQICDIQKNTPFHSHGVCTSINMFIDGMHKFIRLEKDPFKLLVLQQIISKSQQIKQRI